MTYNKLNKVFCDCCNKSLNKKYFKKHCEQKRHLRLKAEQEAKNGITVNNMVRDIKDIIEKYGLNNVKEICDMMTEKVEEPVNEIVDIGKNCWDIINAYKADLELKEKVDNVNSELIFKHRYRDVRYLFEICFGEECLEASKYVNGLFVARQLINYDFNLNVVKQREFLRFKEPRNIKYIVEGVEYMFNQLELRKYKNKRDRKSRMNKVKGISRLVGHQLRMDRIIEDRSNPHADRTEQ